MITVEILRKVFDGEAFKIDSPFKIFCLQKVNDKWPFGDGQSYILKTTPNPSDLENPESCALDYEEAEITETDETLKIDKTFVLALSVPRKIIVPAQIIPCICCVGIVRTGSTEGDVYWTKGVFNLGIMDASDNFTSKVNGEATPNFSTNSTTYQKCSGLAFLNLTNGFEIAATERLALRVQIYNKIATTEKGEVRLYLSRGSFDSFMQIFLQ